MLEKLVRLYAEGMQDAPRTCVAGNPEELLLNHFHLRDGERYIHVGLKCHADLAAVRTLHRRLVQAMHQVDNDRLVSL